MVLNLEWRAPIPNLVFSVSWGSIYSIKISRCILKLPLYLLLLFLFFTFLYTTFFASIIFTLKHFPPSVGVVVA